MDVMNAENAGAVADAQISVPAVVHGELT